MMETLSKKDFISQLNPALYSISLEITDRCNNNCRHCYVNKSENDECKNYEATTDFYKRIISEAESLGCMLVKISGGEPLVFDGFDEIYTHIVKSGMSVSVFTNARLIDESRAMLFSKYPPKAPFEVSVYGLDNETYTKVARKSGAYDEMVRGIKFLCKYNIPTILKFVSLSQNINQTAQFESWAKDIYPSAKALTSYSSPLMSRTDEKDNKKERMNAKDIVAANFESPDYVSKIAHLIAPPRKDRKIFSCTAGKEPRINSSMNLLTCGLMSEDAFSVSLKDKPLEIALSELKKNLSDAKPSKGFVEKCSSCIMFSFCENCPAKAFAEHKSLEPVEYFCEISTLTARKLGIIGEDEFPWNVFDCEEKIRKFKESLK